MLFLYSLWFRAAQAFRRDEGQTTAEYALVILAAAAVAVVLIAWAHSSGKLPQFFDQVIDNGDRGCGCRLIGRPTARHARRAGFVRGDHGTAAVEFALVLPLVLTITLAMVQVGLLVRDRLVVESAARAGARVAAVQDDGAAIQAAVTDAASSLDAGAVSVNTVRAGTQR